MMAQPEPDEFIGVSLMIVDDLAARSSAFRDWIRRAHILGWPFSVDPFDGQDGAAGLLSRGAGVSGVPAGNPPSPAGSPRESLNWAPSEAGTTLDMAPTENVPPEQYVELLGVS